MENTRLHDNNVIELIEAEMYTTPLKGVTKMWGEPVIIIGEHTIRSDGRIIECYIYSYRDRPMADGKPFIAAKSNIHVEGGQ